MKIRDLITEGRDAPLYHGMSIRKAMDVFKNDKLKASWKHILPNGKQIIGTSFSRNKLLRYGYVTIEVEQDKLTHTHKIIPLDGDYINYNKKSWDNPLNIRSREMHGWSSMRGRDMGPEHTLAEEFVIGDIFPLNKYIIKIIIDEPEFGTEVMDPDSKEYDKLSRLLWKYSDKFKIEVQTSI